MNWWTVGFATAMLGIVLLAVGAFRENAAAAETEHAQSIELAVQKVEIADLKRRVRQLEDDMDRVAPHRVPTP